MEGAEIYSLLVSPTPEESNEYFEEDGDKEYKD